jgi:murein DD-endopeptidase MepM/ murein hydrolase activator NlpD
MTHVTRRRHVAALVFATTCGVLAGMAIMAVLTLVFGGEPYRPAADPPMAITRVDPPATDARPVIDTPTQAKVAVPDATHADAPARPDDPPDLDEALEDLRRRRLDVPLGTIDRASLRSSFNEVRGGSRRHEAMDLLAPRHTPVVAVEAGIVARLFNSKAGGITIYQFDPTTTYTYYYAHLERYAPGLVEGATVSRGQVIGYVGTSGNAPENTPHLHFAIFVLDEDKRWWQGTPVDPFDVLR